MSKALTLSLVIPVHNEEYYLKRCLEAISRQARRPDEIIVVDNNCTDSTTDIAKQFPHVKIVREKSQGVLYASRTGFDTARCDIICRIDADTVMGQDWIEQVQAFFQENPSVSAVTGNCYFYDFPYRTIIRKVHHAIYYSLQKLIAGTEILWGSNMAITNAAWQSVRGDCVNHPGIHEDIDLSFHLQNHRLLIRRSPKLMVGVSMLRGRLNLRKLIRYLWPWPSNTLASYFWSWPRTYWVNKRYFQSVLITLVMLATALLVLPVAVFTWLIIPSSS